MTRIWIPSLPPWVTRREIANAVGVSEDYLSRVFSRELGLTPWDYLNRYRIIQAKVLLLSTTENIGTISRQVGFKDKAYCNRCPLNSAIWFDVIWPF